jgi:hypothetical protein
MNCACQQERAASHALTRVDERGVVADDGMIVQRSGDGPVDLAQERLMPMTRLATREHGAVEHVQGCRKRRSRVGALAVVRDALDIAQAHGRRWLFSPTQSTNAFSGGSDTRPPHRAPSPRIESYDLRLVLREDRILGFFGADLSPIIQNQRQLILWVDRTRFSPHRIDR